MSCAIGTRRFSRKFFENTVELGERLESGSEGDFTDSSIGIQEKITRFFESVPCNIIHKICAGDLLKLLAQMICADVDRFRHFPQRKFVAGMLLDETSRLPDLHWFCSNCIP